MVVLTAILTTLGYTFGIPEVTIQWIIQIAAAFLIGQGVADFGVQGKQPRDYFDKKFIFTLISGVVLAVANYFEVPEDLMKWLTHLMSGFLVTQGIADAGKKGEVEGELSRLRLEAIRQEKLLKETIEAKASVEIKDLQAKQAAELAAARKLAEEKARAELGQ